MRWHALSAFGAAMLLAATAVAADPPPNFVLHEPPQLVPDIQFKDDAGRAHSLVEFRGKLVLLNIWATWCIPCRKEMPALDRLETKLGGPEFEVVALSIDRGGPDAVKKFYAENGIEHLPLSIDSSSKVLRDVGAAGLPTTLLIGRRGLEIGRLTGPAEWDSPETVEFLRSLIAQQIGAPQSRQEETHT